MALNKEVANSSLRNTSYMIRPAVFLFSIILEEIFQMQNSVHGHGEFSSLLAFKGETRKLKSGSTTYKLLNFVLHVTISSAAILKLAFWWIILTRAYSKYIGAIHMFYVLFAYRLLQKKVAREIPQSGYTFFSNGLDTFLWNVLTQRSLFQSELFHVCLNKASRTYDSFVCKVV